MNEIECETCIKRKTKYCPTSIDCMATDDMPYYQNRIMLLEENQKLKEQLQQKEDIILKEQLQQKEDIINKAKDFIESYYDFMDEKYDFEYFDGYKLLEILDNKGE